MSGSGTSRGSGSGEPRSGPAVDHETKAPSRAALPPGGREVTVGARAHIVKNHLKVATGASSTAEGGSTVGPNKFTIYSDEPAFIGGDDSHPQPLLYIAAGIAF